MSKIITILCAPRHEETSRLARDISRWLEDRGNRVATVRNARDIPMNTELLLTIGGDGTLLGAGRKVAGHDIPLFGINSGKIGFLTGCEASDWTTWLEQALEGRLPIRKCAILEWELWRGSLPERNGIAINDVVIGRGHMARLVELAIKIDGISLAAIRCDGLIISSSLGSSGYNASAGGPIIHPDMAAMCLTPICPYLNNFHPTVFPATSHVEISIAAYGNECSMTVDGQDCWGIKASDRITVGCASEGLPFIITEERFIEKLKQYYAARPHAD